MDQTLSDSLTALLFQNGPQRTIPKALAVQSLLKAQMNDTNVTLYGSRLNQCCRDAILAQHDAAQLSELHSNALKAASMQETTCVLLPPKADGQLMQSLYSQPEFQGLTSHAQAAQEACRQMEEALALAAERLAHTSLQQQHQQQCTANKAVEQAHTAGHLSHSNGNSSTWQQPLNNSTNNHHPDSQQQHMAPKSNGSLKRWEPPAKKPCIDHDNQQPPSGSHIRDNSNNDQWPGQQGNGNGQGNGNRQEQQQLNGFQTARQQYNKELLQQGRSSKALLNSSNGQNGRQTYGLARPKRGGGQQGGGNSSRNGFIPPYLQKAVDGMNNEQPGGQGQGPSGQNGQEGPWSEKVIALLAGPDGVMPPEIEKLEPKIVEQVCHEIMDQSGSIQWDDVAGLQVAKKLLQEMIVWPMTNPSLFTGARAPPKGLLLFGPPGTGKTMIGKAVASNIKATFFSISASSLTSKWIGEGEKMVRALFAVASVLQPSVIFIDEIDSILTARKSDGEHEASRRLKTEMLIQMEGCSTTGDRRVLIIGATNRPEELDEAARRRMPKQLYIPLPCAQARLQMINRCLGPHSGVRSQLGDIELSKIVARTEGYSGSDMKNLIQEACQGPIRDAARQHGSGIQNLSANDLRPVMIKDFQAAARAQKASVTAAEIQRYVEYDARHGAKYVEDTPAEVEEEDW